MVDQNDKVIESKDNDGKVVKVKIKTPTAIQYRDSQIVYNKAFREALDSGALLRQKINDYMTEQGIWNEKKEEAQKSFIAKIANKEKLLKGGGIKLSEAKQIALEIRDLRDEFKVLLAEKNALDQNSAEGQADNARFAELVRLCIINPGTNQPYFPDQQAYDASADQAWVIEASSELANILYGLDPDYENNLVENKFLKEFNFVNEDLRFINDDGHLVDSEGKLVNEDGRFIAYRTKKGKDNQDENDIYFVNALGEEVVESVDEDGDTVWVAKSLANQKRQPFLDEDGKPIAQETQEKESKEEEKAEEKTEAKTKTTKRKPRATKTDSKTV